METQLSLSNTRTHGVLRENNISHGKQPWVRTKLPMKEPCQLSLLRQDGLIKLSDRWLSFQYYSKVIQTCTALCVEEDKLMKLMKLFGHDELLLSFCQFSNSLCLILNTNIITHLLWPFSSTKFWKLPVNDFSWTDMAYNNNSVSFLGLII